MGDVDISAEAVERMADEISFDCWSASQMLRALSARITELESLNATRNQQNAAALAEVERLKELEVLLYDGYAVYKHLSKQANQRTSYENVADTLDAMSRAFKAALAPQSQQPDNATFLYRWFTTPNPALGNTSPMDMLKAGRGEKLAKWIEVSAEEGGLKAEG